MLGTGPEQTLTPAKGVSGTANLGSTPGASPVPPRLPPAIPDHELLRCIGRGSYGEVWLGRNVMGSYRAVKIVNRATFDSDRPYEREFEGLKKFEPVSRTHPSQVAILHVGRNDHEGYFYYVMELADDQLTGRQVDPERYAPRTLRSELKPRGRLPFEDCVRIGIALTTALEHLHENGLIHRDIKPSNIILVNGQPKLADIGLVATVDATCSFVGTEGYLPREGPGTPQADLYSLGKVLYEMSTGKDRRDFPELPLQLDSAEEEKGVMEFNAIVVRACKPDARDRYQSAGQMHEDLLLLLAGKSVRRTHAMEHRLKLMTRIGVGAVAVMVLGAFPYYLAIKEARLARANEMKAQTEAVKSRQVARFLEQMLAGVSPSVALGRDTAMLKDILDTTATRVGTELTNQPEVEAELLLVIGKTYQELGLFTNALEMARKTLRLRKLVFGPKNPLVADVLANIGALMYDMGDLSAAERTGREALGLRIELLGEHTNVATSYNNVGLALWNQGKLAEAESMEREALRIRQKLLPDPSLDVAKTMNNLGGVMYVSGNFPGAETNFSQALSIFKRLLPPEHPFLGVLQNNLATLLYKKGDLTAAARLHSANLETRKQVLKRHPDVAYSMTQLAVVLTAQGDLQSAETLLRDALAMEGELLPREHGNVADTLAALGTVLIKKGDLEGATTNHQEALAIRRKLLGTENADVADSLDAVALLHAARGDWGGAEGMLQAAVTTDRKTQGEDHPNVLYILAHLAWVLQNEGKLAAAESSRGESSALRSKHGDYSVRAWSESNYDLADVLQAQGKFPQAEPLLSETAEYLQQCAAVNAPLRRRGLERLVRFYEAWDRADPGAGKRDQTGDCKKKLDALDALMARK